MREWAEQGFKKGAVDLGPWRLLFTVAQGPYLPLPSRDPTLVPPHMLSACARLSVGGRWTHEPEIQELFLQRAKLYQMDERRDSAARGLDTDCLRADAHKAYPTPALT